MTVWTPASAAEVVRRLLDRPRHPVPPLRQVRLGRAAVPGAREQAAHARVQVRGAGAHQDAGHQRVARRLRVAAQRLAGPAQGDPLLGALGRGERHAVQLVGVARRQRGRPLHPAPADDDPRARVGDRAEPRRRQRHVLAVLAVGVLVGVPQPADRREVLLQAPEPRPQVLEREAMLAVLGLQPAGAQAQVDPRGAVGRGSGHLRDGRHDLREVARRPERDRRHQRPQDDVAGLAREPRQGRPRVGGRQRLVVARARPHDAAVVVAAVQARESAVRDPQRDGQQVVVGETLLRFQHDGEAHGATLPRGPCGGQRGPFR